MKKISHIFIALILVPKSIFSFPPISDPDTSLATDSLGNQIAVWSEKNQIMVSESTPNSDWSIPTLLSSPMAVATNPKIEIAPNDDATIVWLEENSIKAVSKSVGGSWAPSKIKPNFSQPSVLHQTPAVENSSILSEFASSKPDPSSLKQNPLEFSVSSHHRVRLKSADLNKTERKSDLDSPSHRFDPSGSKSIATSSQESTPLNAPLSTNAIDAPSGGALLGAQIGFAAGTSAPTNGLIVSGVSGFGLSGPSTSNQVSISPNSSTQLRGLLVTGSFAGASQIGISSAATYSNASSFAQSILSSPVFAAAAATSISNATCFYASPLYTANAGTITFSAGYYFDGGGTGVGTVTNAYGAYLSNPVAGTTKTAIYGDNLSVGYAAVSPPSSGAIISGKVGIGTSAPASTTSHLQINGSASQSVTYNGVSIEPTLTQTGNNQSTQMAQITGVQVVNGSGTNSAEMLRVAGTYTATTTINNAFGIHLIAHAGSGTINNAYGLFVENPGVGSTKTATYTDNLSVGYTAITPPSSGAIISGSVGIGTSAPGGYLDVQGSVSASGAVYGSLLRTAVTETGSASGTCGVFIGGTHTVNGSGTNTVSYMQVFPVVTATTTVSAAYGINLFPGSGSGTVNAAYGLYANNPGFGTTKTAIYGDNLSVGYTAVSPPSSGAIISGQFGVGTSSVNVDSKAEILSNGTYGLRISGTQTTLVGNQQGSIWIRSALQPTSGTTGICAHILNQAFTIAPAGQTIANTTACYLAQDYEFNAGTITNAYQLLIGTTASGTGSGTITNAYGAYIGAPNAGTKICALYTDNFSVGYTATTPPSNGAIISGKVGIGTSSPASTTSHLQIDGSASQSSTFNGVVITPTLTQTGNGQSTQILQVTGTQVVNGSGTNSCEMQRVFGTFTATTTINNAFGIHIVAHSGSGTINNSYGLFVENPGVGTTKTATYTENLSVGYAGTTPPTTGAIITGQVGIGTSSPTANGFLDVSGSASGTSAYGTLLRTSLTETGAGAPSSLYVKGTITANSASGPNSVYVMRVEPTNITATTTISNLYGLRVSAVQAASGTITEARGGYFDNPGVGTNRTALYAEDMLVGYGGVTPPTNGMLIRGNVSIGTSTAPTSALQVAGDILPATNKTNNLGSAGLRWNTIFYVTATTGTSRLADARAICPYCGTRMKRGTGTTIVLGDKADYIHVFCKDCGHSQTESLSHLPVERLSQRKAPPEIRFLGFQVVQYSGNSRGIQVLFSYGDKENSTYLSDVEYEEFSKMNPLEKRLFIQQLGQREWEALEEARLMKEECSLLQVELDSLSEAWKGTDLLQR